MGHLGNPGRRVVHMARGMEVVGVETVGDLVREPVGRQFRAMNHKNRQKNENFLTRMVRSNAMELWKVEEPGVLYGAWETRQCTFDSERECSCEG